MSDVVRAALPVGPSRPDGPGPAQLTPEGADLLRSLAETVAPITREVFADIAQDDLATAHRVMQQIIGQAHRLHVDKAQ